MRIVFFGTPYYVLPILELLQKTFKEHGVSPIEAVVTATPKPVGRKQELEYSPVDQWAHKKDIPIYFDSTKLIKDGLKVDLGILASYGGKIPQEVINFFPKGILVIHPSILPDFRWSSPVPAMMVTNTPNIGASILKMDDKWDHGPIVTQFKDELLKQDNNQTLRDRLFERSGEVLVQALPPYLSGKIKPKAQDDNKASFARMITKEDAFIPPKYLKSALHNSTFKGRWKIDFIKDSKNKSYSSIPSANSLDLFIRAMTPWPGAWTIVSLKQSANQPAQAGDKAQKRLKILKSYLQPTTNNLQLESVQLEGKNPVSWEEFKRGYPNFELGN